ncbi:MAG TPA: tRNA (guanosine(46)-N7)-methyltransferase TrmB [Acidobacteriota bacterium]|nr:tRNA (guanosine(46)-N7)-methyltransferase TrmB [Acidobacteriota bacterium]
MGRKKHRDWKLEQGQRNQVPWKELPRPLDWTALFRREAPLEVEIGFGNGEYLCEIAADAPERNFVGLELKAFRLKKALRQLELRGLGNVRLVLADARVAFQRFFRQKSISRVHSLFSDPWPKAKHEKFRLFSRNFLELMNSRLREAGEAFIVTDQAAYSEWILEQAQDTGFDCLHRLTPPHYGTKFERKWREERGQQRFHEIRLQKRCHIDRPLITDIELEIPPIQSFRPDSFSPGSARGDIVVEFRRVKWDADRQQARLLAIAVDGPLVQNVGMTIARRGPEWSLELQSPQQVVPSPSVQRALDLAAAACASSPPARAPGSGWTPQPPFPE